METLIFHEENCDRLARLLRVLGEPSRLRILTAIRAGECCVNRICDRTGLSQANVSKHLQLLKDAGLVSCRRKGNQRCYRLVDPEIMHLCDAFCRRLNRSPYWRILDVDAVDDAVETTPAGVS